MFGDSSSKGKRNLEENYVDSPEKKLKMSGHQNKTPITILQELCAKINPKDPPVYNEMKETPTEFLNSSMKFFIRCYALGQSSLGGGVTKKIAKHNAAEILLNKHKYSDGLDDLDTDQQTQTWDSNSVSELLDYCTVRNFHKPEFKCISSFGPSHDPSFTFECKLDSARRIATAGNKQLAKQLSAKAVLEIIKTSHPDLEKKLAVINNTSKTMPGTLRDKIKTYLELKKQNKVHLMGTTIKDRHNFFNRQDEDFCTSLREILKSESINQEEKYEKLLNELSTLWPHRIEKFEGTELMKFELLIDYEVFTCVIIATSSAALKNEILQYFNEMLYKNESENDETKNDFDFLANELIIEYI